MTILKQRIPGGLGKFAAIAACVCVLALNDGQRSSAYGLEGLTIGSGSVGADFFVLGTSLQQVLSRKFPDILVENTATSGSVENLRLLRRKEIDVGIYTTTSIIDGWDAKGAFATEDPYREVRTLAGIWPNTYNVITLENSKIASMADLKGARVGIGPDPSTVDPIYSQFFEASGIRYKDDFDAVYASYADIFRMLAENQVDAVVGFTSGGKVTASIQELASARDIRWVSLDAEALRAAGLKPIALPAGTLPDQSADIVAVEIGMVALGTTADLPEDVAYEFVKAVHENLGELSTLQPAVRLAVSEPSTLTTSTDPYPYHPGAVRYWKEVGLWTDEK